MTNTHKKHDELITLITSLTETVTRGEHRTQSLERIIRWGSFVLMLFMLLFSYNSFNMIRDARAESPRHLFTDLKQEGKHVLEEGKHLLERGKAELQHLEGEAKTNFTARMHAIKKDLASVEHLHPGRSIAVILHDMKIALEAMPLMATDMHAMRGDMHSMAGNMYQMNGKMGVMAHGVDNTMGRIGRIMP